MGKKRGKVEEDDDNEQEDDEEDESEAQEAAGRRLVLPTSRIKAIAKQDPDVGGLSNQAVASISAATHELLSKLLLGAAEQARAKQGKGGGKASTVVTITPEDIRAFVLANNDLAFLRARVVETQANGFLEGYRARTREVQKAASKRTAKKGGHLALVKGIVGANHGGQDDDDEDEAKDEDEVVEAAAAKAQQKDGGTGGAGQGAGGGGGGGKGGKSGAAAGAKKEVVLDEDYDD